MNNLFLELRTYFKPRKTEWLSGAAILIWGLIALQQQFLFETFPMYISMAYIADPVIWTYGAIFIGFIKLLFLVINGSWKRSVHLRTIGSCMSISFWFAILLAYLNVPYITPIIVLILVIIIADIIALLDSAAEAKHSDIKKGVVIGSSNNY
jgi:hypothetical protein